MVTLYPPQVNPNRPFSLATPGNFTASQVDTDQWAAAVAAMGGKYAVLNVKDESGFLLFDGSSCDYDYSIRQSPVWDEVGDITARFVESCRKHGILPGIYYLVWGNFYMNMTNTPSAEGMSGYDCAQDTEKTRQFEKMSLCHLEHLMQRYGRFAEIWNDGGAPCRPEFEAKIAALTDKYQNDSVIFQGTCARSFFPSIVIYQT